MLTPATLEGLQLIMPVHVSFQSFCGTKSLFTDTAMKSFLLFCNVTRSNMSHHIMPSMEHLSTRRTGEFGGAVEGHVVLVNGWTGTHFATQGTGDGETLYIPMHNFTVMTQA